MRALIPGTRQRAGFSLIELMVILALSTIIMGGLASVLVRQQRFYRGTADLIETRSQIRQAAGIIPSDLRGVSTKGGDIIAISPTSMLFRATIGQAVACIAVPGTYTLDIPPLTLANKNTLASFTMTPSLGDTVFVYHDGPTEAAGDDEWKAYGIAGAPVMATTSAPCVELVGTDLTTPRYSFPLNEPLQANISIGTPLRFVRRTKYSLYQASDGAWYLGYCSPDCAAGAAQPIAGPFLPEAGGSAGVSFSYVNEAGNVTAVPDSVAQVSIVVRGQTKGIVDLGGYANTHVGDSLRFSVAIRNRR